MHHAFSYQEEEMNTPLEYILVGVVALLLTIYLFIALLAPERF
jgi:K+-transporting ATPase KdpF subunit